MTQRNAPPRQNSSEPWRVGVLFSRSGCLATIEETQFRGTIAAIDHINDMGGIDGREILPIIYDPASDDTLFRAYAHHLLVEEGVSSIFGCYASSSRKAVLPIFERFNGLLWYPTVYEGFEYSPNIIYTGSCPNQNTIVLFDYLVARYGKRVYFVGSDYVYPHGTNRILRMLAARHDGEVAGESYVPLHAGRHEFVSIMRDIGKAQPDFIFSTVVGDSTTFLYQAFADAGFDAQRVPIASLTTTEAEIQAMGPALAEGHYTAGSYFQGMGGESEKTFITHYTRRFGEHSTVNMCAESAYFQVQLLAKALSLTNSLETDVIRSVVLGSSIDAPQGCVSVNPASNHANLWSRVGRANSNGQFDIVHQSLRQIDADPFLLASLHGEGKVAFA